MRAAYVVIALRLFQCWVNVSEVIMFHGIICCQPPIREAHQVLLQQVQTELIEGGDGVEGGRRVRGKFLEGGRREVW